MKKYFIGIAFLFVFLLSCNDGDVTIQRIEFRGTEAYSCTGNIAIDFLYKTQDKQALII